MAQIVLIGFGAGAAAALLFASIATGSIVATFLFYLAPLPILIAGLAWSHWAALVAGVSASAGLGTILGFYLVSAFLVGIALPAWWLAYLVMLARPTVSEPAGTLDWYPPGRLILWAAIIGAAVVMIAVPNVGSDKESFYAALRVAFERAIRMQVATPDTLERLDLERMIDLMLSIVAPAAAVIATLIYLVNLWLAGRIVSVSGRLRRPWPDLTALTLPPVAPALAAAAIAGSFLPDIAGVLAGILAASLLTAFAILGFAVMHSITQGMNHRGLVLGGLYASVLILLWPVLAAALLGLADAAFDFRQRIASKRGPPTLRT
jgi:hypothetical protein